MTPFTSKKHILFISKPIWMIFVTLDVLSVKSKYVFEVQKKKKQ